MSWLIVILLLFVPKYLCSMQNVKYPHHTLGFILGGFHNMEQQPVLTKNQMSDNGPRVKFGLRRDRAAVRHGR